MVELGSRKSHCDVNRRERADHNGLPDCTDLERVTPVDVTALADAIEDGVRRGKTPQQAALDLSVFVDDKDALESAL